MIMSTPNRRPEPDRGPSPPLLRSDGRLGAAQADSGGGRLPSRPRQTSGNGFRAGLTRLWDSGARHRRRRIPLLLVTAALLCLNLTGCVFRRMTIRSDPPGALVFVDDEPVGYTPTSVDFTYYGTREIRLVKDGYETMTVLQDVPAPWYQVPPIDFFADNLLPVQVTNRHEFFYALERRRDPRTVDLLDRARALRSETQFGP